jgi:two-component system response regulator AtoC
MVKEGKFRDDLYYRLNIVTIHIPPLRERREDVPILIDYLLKKINRDLHKNIVGVSKEMMEIFLKYPWPGNVRELENLLVRAVVVSKGQILGVTDFPDLLGGYAQAQMGDAFGERDVIRTREDGKILTIDEVEERHIRKVIAIIGKNKGEICEALGISRPTLERKLEKYQITFE